MEALGADGSKRKSLVDTIFGIRGKIKRERFFTILCFADVWVPTWKPTKLPQTDPTIASNIYQLRLGHGNFRSYLTRLPNYDSTRCQCSEPDQTTKHLLLGCPLYKEERERAGIERETTLQSLLFTPKGTAALIDFIQETRVDTRRWLLQSARESGEEDTWGWGSLQEAQERDGEEMG